MSRFSPYWLPKRLFLHEIGDPLVILTLFQTFEHLPVAISRTLTVALVANVSRDSAYAVPATRRLLYVSPYMVSKMPYLTGSAQVDGERSWFRPVTERALGPSAQLAQHRRALSKDGWLTRIWVTGHRQRSLLRAEHKDLLLLSPLARHFIPRLAMLPLSPFALFTAGQALALVALPTEQHPLEIRKGRYYDVQVTHPPCPVSRSTLICMHEGT